ncbi:MAG: TIGR01458 family HAD-type hydrolase, partial [Pseudohongiellaceae bacterium]
MTASLQVKGLVLDMDGVFYVGDELIDGAAEALAFLRKNQIAFRFITNTTTRTPADLMAKLEKLGLDVRSEEIFTAVSATEKYLSMRGKPSCYLLVRESVKSCFDKFVQVDDAPDFVVIGDIGATWDYETLNRIFNMLMNGSRLICMHRNKYWQTEEGLRMDIGAFVAALEYVSGKEAIVIGKPAPGF